MIRHLLILLLGSVSLWAQSPAAKDLQVRFLAERSPQQIGQVLLAAGDNRSTPFDLPSNFLSAPMTPVARAFSLRAVTPDVSLASITLPEDGKSFIVLLVPAKEGGFKPIVIRSDDPAFKPGDVHFYNHTPKTILGYVGTAKFSLDPEKGLLLRPTGARAENFYDVGFGVREEQGNRTLSQTRWPVDDKVRSYVFFFVNPNTNLLDFRAVDEFVPPPEKP